MTDGAPIVAIGVRRKVASALERGTGFGLARAASQLAPFRADSHERLGTSARVVAVGGATLGGSFKTPLAIALARALAREGASVALVGHAYGSSLRDATRVTPDDPAWVVGDEASLAARELGDAGVPVVVGRTRRRAASLVDASILVADAFRGVADLRILAVDGEAPFGSEATFPAGDLRVPVREAVAWADRIAAIVDVRHEGVSIPGASLVRFDLELPPSASGARVAVVTALARPERFVRALVRRGVDVVVRVELPDHGKIAVSRVERALRRAPPFDAIVTTSKCARSLPPTLAGFPLLVAALRLSIPDDLVRLARGAPSTRARYAPEAFGATLRP